MAIGKGVSHLDASHVRGDHHEVLVDATLANRLHQHGRGVEMIHGNIKEALNLPRVKIDGEHAVHASSHEKVRHQFGRDRHPRAVFAILAGIAKEWQNGRDAGRAGTTHGIHHDQQLHQVLIRRRTGRLNDENVAAADVFVDLDKSLTVGESRQFGGAELGAEDLGDQACERGVRGATEDLQAFNHGAAS
jgi:hypothetical protein